MSDLFCVRSVDLFAGGGGASHGIVKATGQAPLVAINHDPEAVAMHAANHPGTLHLCESIYDVEPFRPHGQQLDLLWASPDCTHFSRAKGAAPRSPRVRGLAWVVVRWAEKVRPKVIALENVAEFQTWGPLDADGHPIAAQAGETFRAWVTALKALGYAVEWRELVAADYGAPTTRRRLFVVARCDGEAIIWPEPTHGLGRAHPWRAASEVIDWSLPCPSIFGRSKPLADSTLRRIAAGLRRYVVEADDPYIVEIDGRPVAATMVQTGYGERAGQRPRALDIRAPLGTVVAGGAKHALVCAWLAKHYTGVVGQDLRQPLGTITTVDHHSLVCAYLTAYYGSERDGQPCTAPLRTVPCTDRFGLCQAVVTVRGEQYVVEDIGLRMLQPRELALAQGFPADYILTGTKRSQVARVGNSAPPPVVAAVVAAQFPAWRLPLRSRVAA